MILHLLCMRRNVNRNVFNDRTNVSATAGLRLHINFAESGPTSLGFQSLSVHSGILPIVNDFETALISFNYCVRACL